MMKLRFAAAAIACALAIGPAHADDKVKITFREALKLSGALTALDGHDDVVKDGQRQSVVKLPYKFGPGLRVVISKDLARLAPVVAVYQDAIKAIRAEVSRGKKIEDDSPELIELNQRNDELLKVEEDMEPLIRIKSSELVGDNPIPGTVLAALWSIIDD